MAIIAVLEVDDQGSVVVRNFRDAFSDMSSKVVADSARMNAATAQQATAAKQQADAMTQMVAQGRAVQSQMAVNAQGANVYTQALKLGVSASTASAQATQQLATATQAGAKFAVQAGSAQATLSAALARNRELTPQLTAEQIRLSAAHQQGAAGATQQGSALDSLSTQVRNTALIFGALGAGIFALLKDSAELAARVETLGVVMGVMAKNAQVSQFEMQVQVEAVKRLGITTQEATNSVIQFVQANLKLADASKLARVAQDLAVVAGLNSSQAFERLTSAIQIQQPLLLRTFGIVTGLSSIYADYAKSINKTVKDLDEMDKKQAVLNKILTEGEKVAGAYEQAMSTAGKQLTSFARFVEEAQLALGQALVPALGLAIRVGTEFLKFWIALDPALQRAAASFLTVVGVAATLAAAFAAARWLGIIQVFVDLRAAIIAVNVALEAQGAAAAASTLLGMINPVMALVVALGLLAGAYVYFSSKTDENADVQVKAAAATQANIDALTQLSTKIQDLSNVQDPTNEQTNEFNELLLKLTKIAPGAASAIDNITNAHAMGIGVLGDAINKERELMRAYYESGRVIEKSAAKEVESLKASARAADARVLAIQTQLDAVKRGEKGYLEYTETVGLGEKFTYKLAASQSTLERAMGEAAKASNAATTAALSAAGAYERTHEELDSLGRSLPGHEQELLDFNKSLVSKDLKQALVDYPDLATRIRTVGKSMEYLKTAVDPQVFNKRLGEINEAWEKHVKEAQAEAKKAAAAYKSAFEGFTGTSTGIEEHLKALGDALVKTAGNAESYQFVLKTGAGDLQKWALMSDDMRKKLNLTVPQVEALAAALGEVDANAEARGLSKVTQEVEQIGSALAQISLERMQHLNEDLAASMEAASKQQIAEARDTADKVYEIQRDLYERNVVAKKDEVDQAHYQEQRRIDDIVRSAAREKDLMLEGLKDEQHALDVRIRGYLQDVIQHRAAVLQKVQDEVNGAQAMLQVAEENGDKLAVKQAEINLKNLQRKQELVQELADTDLRYESRRIEQTARAEQQIVDAHAKGVQAIIAQSGVMVDQQVADAQRAQADITVAYDRTFQAVMGLMQSIPQTFLNGLKGMLDGAKSFKDVLIDIWHSIRDTLFDLFGQVLAQWLRTLAKMAAAKFAGNLLGNVAGGAANTIKGAVSQAGSAYVGQAVAGVAARAGGGVLASAPMQAQGWLGPGYAGSAAGGTGAAAGGWGSKLAAFGKFAKTPLGGAAIGAGTGAMVGWAVGSKTGSIAKGVGWGAGTGAAAGSIGGPIGAGIGALVGGIAGWLGAKKAQEEIKKLRAEFVETVGGIEELKRKATEAGVSIEKMMSTKSPKEFDAEVRKVANALQVHEMITGLEAVNGGFDNLKKKAEAAGVSLDEIYAGGQSAEQLAEQIEKVNKALELQNAKDSLAQTFSQMMDLRKAAQLVGFDLNKLYDSKTIEEFNGNQQYLNELLEKQKLRIEGLQTAAAGLQQRMEGMVATLQKDFEKIFPKEEQFDKLAKGFEKARKGGFKGDLADFGSKGQGLSGKQIAALRKEVDEAQASFSRMGMVATGVFAGILRETGDIVAAMNAVSPALDTMIQLQKELGLEAGKGLKQLLDFRKVIKNNEDVANSLSGITQIIRGMADAGALTAEMFNALGDDASAQFDKLKERGVSTKNSMLLMQPTLQALYEAQKQFGFATDETTQKLIDQGVKQGIIGDQFQSVNSKMLDILVIIAKTLGADIPAAYDKWATAAGTAGQAGVDAANNTAAATGGAKEAIDGAAGAQEQFNGKTAELDLHRDKWGLLTGDVDAARRQIGEAIGAQGEFNDKLAGLNPEQLNLVHTEMTYVKEAIASGVNPNLAEFDSKLKGLTPEQIQAVHKALQDVADQAKVAYDAQQDVNDAVNDIDPGAIQDTTGDLKALEGAAKDAEEKQRALNNRADDIDPGHIIVTKGKVDDLRIQTNLAMKQQKDLNDAVKKLDDQPIVDAAGSVKNLSHRLDTATTDWKQMGNAAHDAGVKAEKAATRAAEGSSPTGVKQLILRLRQAIAELHRMGEISEPEFRKIENLSAHVSETNIANLIKRIKDGRVSLDDLIHKFGPSLKGLEQVVIKLAGRLDQLGLPPAMRQQIDEWIARHQRSTPPDEPLAPPDPEERVDPRDRPAPDPTDTSDAGDGGDTGDSGDGGGGGGGGGTTVTVTNNLTIDPVFNISGCIDATMIKDKIAPVITTLIKNNVDQMATQIEEKLGQYRKRQP